MGVGRLIRIEGTISGRTRRERDNVLNDLAKFGIGRTQQKLSPFQFVAIPILERSGLFTARRRGSRATARAVSATGWQLLRSAR